MREVLVVPKEVLFKDKSFKGFLKAEENNFIPHILTNYIYKERNEALEHDESVQQIIPYIWIVNKQKGMVFLYTRAPTGGDVRIYEKISGGVGGHIDKNTEEDSADPITDAMMRELSEEVAIKDYGNPKIMGYIKEEKTDIDKYHFGIVAILDTPHEVFPLDDMKQGMFYTIEEADRLMNENKENVETWTEVSWPFIKDYLKN